MRKQQGSGEHIGKISSDQALQQRDVLAADHTRPPYQQNDYIWWITTAKRKETQKKRLHQILDELACGVYL